MTTPSRRLFDDGTLEEIAALDVRPGDIIFEWKNLALHKKWQLTAGGPRYTVDSIQPDSVDDFAIRAKNGAAILFVDKNYRLKVYRGLPQEIPIKDVKVGDQIIAYRPHSDKYWSDGLRWAVTAVAVDHINGFIVNNDDGDTCLFSRNDMERGCDVRVLRPTKSSPVWNGKCMVCNRRTLTLFSSIEHEGGRCI